MYIKLNSKYFILKWSTLFIYFQLFAISNTEGFLHRNFKGEWHAVCQNPYMWAHDACRRETGLIIRFILLSFDNKNIFRSAYLLLLYLYFRPPFIQILQMDPMLKVTYLNTGPGGSMQIADTCFNSSAVYVTCPDLLCGTRVLSTSQLLLREVTFLKIIYYFTLNS